MSCTFSTRAFLFLFILTISTQENHRSDADTHTATAHYVHKADPVFFFQYTYFGDLVTLRLHDWFSVKVISCWWNSCTAKMSFYCLRSLLINHVTLNDTGQILGVVTRQTALESVIWTIHDVIPALRPECTICSSSNKPNLDVQLGLTSSLTDRQNLKFDQM